jgi:hypothetical protein
MILISLNLCKIIIELFQGSYSIIPDPNDAHMHFDIDSLTGIITTRSQFDREEQSLSYIKVKAEDGTSSDAPGIMPADAPNSGML